MSPTRLHLLAPFALVACVGTSDAYEEPAPAETDRGAEAAAGPVAPVEPAGPAVQGPIECGGAQEITLEGVTLVNDEGPAVRASGGCVVTLTRSEIRGSDVGVVASGNARVTLRECRVSGGEAAVVASGNAQVALPETEVVGEVRLGGAAAAPEDGGADE